MRLRTERLTLYLMLYMVLALLAVPAIQHSVHAAPSGNGRTTSAKAPGAQTAGSSTHSANKADFNSTNKEGIDSSDSTNKTGIDSTNKTGIDSTNKTGIDSTKNKAEIDSANEADTVKSWTSENPPTEQDRNFLNSLKWKDHKAGSYVIKTGIIFDKWIAAMQFTVNGKAVLTEYTPPSEYLIFVDPKTGTKSSKLLAADVNEDGAVEVAFLHEKLNDPNYHMYSVYSLNESAPKLVWKSGGKFGDWLTQAHRHGGTLWKGGASPE